MKILVVMPTYNEAQSLQLTVEDLFLENDNVDLLIVDDNSQDGTAQLAISLAKSNSRISVLHREAKQGLGPAYLDGFRYAFSNNYEVVVEMDADGSHRAQDLRGIIAATEDADLVIGSRWVFGGKVQNWPIIRLMLSRFGNLYARLWLGTRIRDMTSGFRAYKADFLSKLVELPVSSQGYSFQVELAYRASQLGVVQEVPITFVERAEGTSKMSLNIVFEALAKITIWGLKRILD